MLASFLQAPEWALEEKEAQEVANAAVAVSRHYNVATTQKAIDWTNLAMVLGAVYGTRIVVASRKKKERAQDVNQPPQPGNLHVMPSVAANG